MTRWKRSPRHILMAHMWSNTSKGGRGESYGGYFILNAACLSHTLGVRVGKAEYKLLDVIGNGDTTRLLSSIFSQCDGRREGNAIDKVVVFKRAFRVVLNGSNVYLLLVERHLRLGLYCAGWHGRDYLETELLLEHGLYKVYPGLIIDVVMGNSSHS